MPCNAATCIKLPQLATSPSLLMHAPQSSSIAVDAAELCCQQNPELQTATKPEYRAPMAAAAAQQLVGRAATHLVSACYSSQPILLSTMATAMPTPMPTPMHLHMATSVYERVQAACIWHAGQVLTSLARSLLWAEASTTTLCRLDHNSPQAWEVLQSNSKTMGSSKPGSTILHGICSRHYSTQGSRAITQPSDN